MLTWIMENMATIIISLGLIAVVAAVIAGMIRSKKKGKTTCGCGCSSCPAGSCCSLNSGGHPAKKKTLQKESSSAP